MTLLTDRCQVCNQTLEFHHTNPLKHEFVDTGGQPATIEELPASAARPSGSKAGGGSGDAVLRLALVKAGVITEADLEEAQMWYTVAEGGAALTLVPDPSQPGKLIYELTPVAELARRVAQG